MIWFLLFVATVVAMEIFACVMHRWVMHGPGWFLHASHHRPRPGRFEANDLYAVIFAVPSILLLYGGVNLDWGTWAIPVGAGASSDASVALSGVSMQCRIARPEGCGRAWSAGDITPFR